MRTNARDPLVVQLLGPGKPYELEDVCVSGVAHQVFKGAPRTLAGIFTRARSFSERTLVVHDDVELTFAEVFARAGAFSAALREQFGVVKGTSVALVMANRIEWIISLIAVTAAGGIAVLVNSRGSAEEILRAVAMTKCKLAIVDAERASLIAADAPDPSWPRIVIGATSPLHSADIDFATISNAAAGVTLDPIEVDPSDGAIVLFTSGTTGFPKGALISHGALTHAVAISGFMGALQDLRYEQEVGETLSEGQRSMTSPAPILGPMFHLGGVMPVIRAMNAGATIYIMSKWNVDIAFDMIERVGVSRMGFVPTMLWDMLRSPRAGPQNIGSILYLSSGSASLDPALVAEIRARMPKCLLANTYGQSETTAWACSISGKAYFDHPSSCGWAAPTINVRVLRDDGAEASIGEPGELWVSSPALMNEYVGDPGATASTLKSGWCATGDIGLVDEAGRFSIVDRKKNMVISGGENIYCAEVERVLTEHPDVLEAMAYGVPDARLGERLVALVVTSPGASVGAEDLIAYCRRRLAIYKIPRAMRLTDELLPRTATGKHHRSAVIERERARTEAH